MQDGSASREFPAKGSHFVVEPVQGTVQEVHKYGKTQQLILETDHGDIEVDVPWHAELEEEETVYVVFGFDRQTPEQKTAYYLFNVSKGSLEEKRRVAKPNKGAGLALLDFALVIILGISMSPIIADMMQNKPGQSLVAVCALIFLLYLMVHKLTYSLLMKQQIQEVEAINEYIQQLSVEPEPAEA